MRVRHIPLPSLEATTGLGAALALAVRQSNPGAILLYGALGAGKTTLTGALVRALPGGDDAEVSSPSFTICNIYCTCPQVHHYDLYRLGPGLSDEALSESLDNMEILTIVEWAEHLSALDTPDDGIECRLVAGSGNTRRAELLAKGPAGTACLALIPEYL